MATKQEIVNEIFKLTENKDAVQKLRHNYHYNKFLGKKKKKKQEIKLINRASWTQEEKEERIKKVMAA